MTGWQRHLPATLEAVDALYAELRTGVIAIPEQERFAVELLLREALTNAFVHATAGEVCCEIEMLPAGIVLRVCDSGPGFDWRRHVHAAPAAGMESGRGIHILQQLFERATLQRERKPGGSDSHFPPGRSRCQTLTFDARATASR